MAGGGLIQCRSGRHDDFGAVPLFDLRQQPASGIPLSFFPLEVVVENCDNFNEPAGGGASSGEPAVAAQPSCGAGPGILPSSSLVAIKGQDAPRPTGKMPALLTNW